MTMSRDAYFGRINDANWAPGWDAIQEAFAYIYGEQGNYLPAAELDISQPHLEGFGVYPSPHGYAHIVTRGLSRIYPHPDAYMNNTSGWGFELTIKWPKASQAEQMDAFRLLNRLAEIIDVNKYGFMSMKRLWKRRDPLTETRFSRYGAALVVVPDTEIESINTIHGEVRFLQIVNISAHDAEKLDCIPGKLRYLVKRIRENDLYISFRLPAPCDCLLE